jgi:hypothetical protein
MVSPLAKHCAIGHFVICRRYAGMPVDHATKDSGLKPVTQFGNISIIAANMKCMSLKRDADGAPQQWLKAANPAASVEGISMQLTLTSLRLSLVPLLDS